MMFGWPKKDRARGWTGVDIAADGLFGVSVQPPAKVGGKPQVIKCGFMPASDTTTDITADILSKLARKIAVAGYPISLPLNRSDYQILVMPEPPVKKDEMEQSIRWSLGSILEYPPEQANIEWITIPTKQHLPLRAVQIYIIVVRSSVIQQRAELFRQARQPLQAIEIRETAQRNIATLLERPGEGLALVVIGSRGVEITFTFEGELFLDRYIDIPLLASLLSNEEERIKIFDRITLQLQRSIDLINRTLTFMSIGRIIIAPLPLSLAFYEHLTQNISVPVEMLNLESIFDLSLTPELMDEKNQTPYLSSLGAALRGMGSTV